MQNLIKRNSGPNRRTVTDGKTLAEKLAQNEKVLAAAAEEDEARVAAEAAAPPRPAPTGQSGASEPDDTAAIVAAAKAMRDRYAGQPAPAATAKTCLIVDDSRVIRKVSSKIALSLGYVPVEAENGEEALARCKKSMPDLVLTDWREGHWLYARQPIVHFGMLDSTVENAAQWLRAGGGRQRVRVSVRSVRAATLCHRPSRGGRRVRRTKRKTVYPSGAPARL